MLNNTPNIRSSIFCARQLRKTMRILVLVTMFILPKVGVAQRTDLDVKAFLLLKISNYIDWPEANNKDKTKAFVIVTLNSAPFGNVLQKVVEEGKHRINNRKVIVVRQQSIDSLYHCDMVYIPRSERKNIDRIKEISKHNRFLTVSDTDGFGEKGIHINFFIKTNKIRFELNEVSAKESGINVDFHLRNIAKLVEQRKQNDR